MFVFLRNQSQSVFNCVSSLDLTRRLPLAAFRSFLSFRPALSLAPTSAAPISSLPRPFSHLLPLLKPPGIPSCNSFATNSSICGLRFCSTAVTVRDSFDLVDPKYYDPLEKRHRTPPKVKKPKKLTPIGLAPHLKAVVLKTIISLKNPTPPPENVFL